jgi:hypothetical protein
MTSARPAPHGIPDVLWGKSDPGLRGALRSVHGDPTVELPAIITLAASMTGSDSSPRGGGLAAHEKESRDAAVREQEEAFDHEAEPIVAALTLAGAREIHTLWIGRAVATRATLPALEAVASLGQTQQILLDARQNVLT